MKIVALLKGGSKGRPTNLISKDFNLLWHLSNAFSASVLKASKMLNLLDPFTLELVE